MQKQTADDEGLHKENATLIALALQQRLQYVRS
jgi:GAF domain-containing protein